MGSEKSAKRRIAEVPRAVREDDDAPSATETPRQARRLGTERP